MSHETYKCGLYRLTIEYMPDAPPDQEISVLACLPVDNGRQADKIFHEMSIPRLVECLVAGIKSVIQAQAPMGP